jgi:1,4-dihydroxy-2-naphthoate polyprenyltransferase
MSEITTVQRWIKQIRADFLLLSVVLVFLGVSLAYLQGVTTPFWYIPMLLIGVVLSHISVNLFNEYFDFRSGIDTQTNRTPFSGGSGMLVAGHTSPKVVLTWAIITLGVSGGIGLFFCIMSSWWILLVIGIGAFSMVLYTTVLSKVMLSEFFAGLSLGSLVIIGCYLALAQNLPIWVLIISIPSGILTMMLAFLNNFPDVEPDRAGGRHHLVIQLGRRRAAWIYVGALSLCYLVIIGAVLAFPQLSYWVLVGLATLPLAIRAARIVLTNYDNIPNLIPAMGMNVMLVLGTNIALGVGIVLSILF